MEEWPIDWQFFSSEDVDAMDVDSGPTKPKPKSDDLSEYNLDDYDDDAKTTGERDTGNFVCFLAIDVLQLLDHSVTSKVSHITEIMKRTLISHSKMCVSLTYPFEHSLI